MKKNILISLICFFCIAFATAQSTTQDEYTYITSDKGLIFDKQGARNLKLGYSLVNLDFEKTLKWSNGQWKRIRLFTLNKGNRITAIAVEFSDPTGISYKCLCGPNSNESIISKCRSDFADLGKEWDAVLAYAFVELAMLKLF